MVEFQFKKILQAPHPYVFSWADIFIPSVIVFFLLMVMAPFGMAKLSFQDRIFVVFPFGIITAFTVLFNFWIFQKLPINREDWTIGKELLYNLIDILAIGFWIMLIIS